MKKGIFLLMILTLMAGAAWGKNFEVTKKVDDLTVKVDIDKNPPIVGDNNLSLTIKDASGKNIIDAKVKVEYSMPAMPGMPAMKYDTNAALAGKIYKTKVNFSMSGSWNMVIKIARGGKTAQARFTVDAR